MGNKDISDDKTMESHENGKERTVVPGPCEF